MTSSMPPLKADPAAPPPPTPRLPTRSDPYPDPPMTVHTLPTPRNTTRPSDAPRILSALRTPSGTPLRRPRPSGAAPRENTRRAEQTSWMQKVAADPGHSTWYIERFRTMARAGEDLAGEARLVDAMVPRGARILDAGCGTGRVSGALAEAGHDVVGVDVDPALIEAAEQDYPGPRYLVGDLAELDLPARGITEPFDVIVCAGNVMAFLAPSTRHEVLKRFRAHLAPEGRA